MKRPRLCGSIVAIVPCLGLSTWILAADAPPATPPPAAAPAAPAGLAPFSVEANPPVKPTKPAHSQSYEKTLDCFGEKNAGKWMAGGLAARASIKYFALEQSDGHDALHVFTKDFDPGQMLIGYDLTADEGKGFPNYISFLCKSSKDTVNITFNVLPKTALEGLAYRVQVPVKPGAWQRVFIPFAEFAMRGSNPFLQAIGIGLDSPASGSDVYIADIKIGATAVSADDIKAKATMININGTWKFATDPGETGIDQKWNAPEFDDTNWKTLQSNLPWGAQGVTHAGWGWYRQKIVVPKESAGIPMTIVLAELTFDDDAYFNGVRIGGVNGNYPYSNYLLRTYTVPASLIHYGEANTIAIRTWGVIGSATQGGQSGLLTGLDKKGAYYEALLDPCIARFRSAETKGEEQAVDDFDLTNAQQGMPFDIIFRFPH